MRAGRSTMLWVSWMTVYCTGADPVPMTASVRCREGLDHLLVAGEVLAGAFDW